MRSTTSRTASPKRPAARKTRRVQGADEEERGEKSQKRSHDALDAYCVNLNKKAKGGRIDPLIGREAEVERTIQILCRRLEEQPALCRRSRCRQDRDCRGAGAPHRAARSARGAAQRDDLCARHGRTARRNPLSRRFRGAAEGGAVGARGAARGDPVHRRDPYRHRRRSDQRRGDGRLEPVEAGASPAASSAASARPPTRNIATISKRIARSSGAFRRSTSTSRRSRIRSRSCAG